MAMLSNNAFGLITPGRMVRTDFMPFRNQYFKAFLTVPEAAEVREVVVFLCSSSSLPSNYSAMVYWAWAHPIAPRDWQYLGFLDDSMPSSIFTLSDIRKQLDSTDKELELILKCLDEDNKTVGAEVMIDVVSKETTLFQRSCCGIADSCIHLSLKE